MRWALHVTLAARWLDPAETEAFNTPYMVMYAVHDALVKPMAAGMTSPSLAESWQESRDNLSYTFTLRKNAKFHDGSPVTAEDVKFSYERYKGASNTLLKEKVKEVQVLSPSQVRFVLQASRGRTSCCSTAPPPPAWAGSCRRSTSRRSATTASSARRSAPARTSVVSFNPGVELVLEAFDGYWRKAPSVKRLVMRSMVEETTRAAALKRGEVDIAYLLTGPVAEEIRGRRASRLEAPLLTGAFWLDLPDQWDPKSPWHDRRVRLAANHAVDRAAVNQAETLGLLAPDRLHRPAHLPVRAAGRAPALRSGPREEAAGRGRLSQRLRRRRLLSVPALQLHGRGAAEPAAGGRHPQPPAHDGARGLHVGVARQEAARHHPGHHRLHGQRRHPARALRHQERDLRLRLAAAGGRPLRPPGPRGRSQEARGDGAPDPEDRSPSTPCTCPIYELGFIWGVGPRVEVSGANIIPGFAYSAPFEDLKLKP